MAVSTDRIAADIAAVARFTQTPGRGATRPTFSAEWRQARDYVIAEAEKAGCRVRIDAAGNVFARPVSIDDDLPVWLCGSHVDTVPSGGDYDGVAGVVTALELLRSAHEDGVPLALELVIFAEEEGPTFGLGMLGSKALVGELNEKHLARLRNAQGQTYLQAGAPHGVVPESIGESTLRAIRYLGLIELHIEQGPGLWRRDQRLAIVTAIAGRRQMSVTLRGEANHAGATSMSDRKDALAAAAECIVVLEKLARSIGNNAVLTVGRIEAFPNAVNVIPDRVEFTIDFRSPDLRTVESSLCDVRTIIEDVVKPRGIESEVTSSESIPPRPMAQQLISALSVAAAAQGLQDVPLAVSGALHDSAVLATYIPTAMLFVPSRDGISHNPAEFSRTEDIAIGASVVERLVRRPTIAAVNAMSRQRFVATFGGVVESSPWIAERAWEQRPFASTDDLHKKLNAIIWGYSNNEQIQLIAAHPDLVGKLAKQGRLTSESTREQAAAGLDQLTADEIAAFDRYNAAYRDRFGFPFVICARENRKSAILGAFPNRLRNTREQEIATALGEIAKIARLRLFDIILEV